jgi:uncharacterized protein
MRMLVIGLLTVLGMVVPSFAQQAGFDCRLARTADEVAICSDTHLSELDRIGAFAFKFAREHGGDRRLIAGAQSLLLARMACQASKPCILDHQVQVLQLYQQRGIPITIPDWVTQYRAELAGAGSKQPNLDEPSQRQPGRLGPATVKCLLEVNDVHYIGGLCTFTPIDSQGSFRIADGQGLGLIAQVMSTKKDEGAASWNGPLGGNNSGTDLGTAYLQGGCWETDKARICSWDTDAQVSLEKTPPEPSPGETVFWGSRVGMYDDIISKADLNSSHAQIRTAPSRNGAITFCRQYDRDYSLKCIENQLANSNVRIITANCASRQFVDFSGGSFQFLGPNNNKDGDVTASYLIRNARTGEILDGSSASGYSVEGGIFKALCPAAAPAEF